MKTRKLEFNGKQICRYCEDYLMPNLKEMTLLVTIGLIVGAIGYLLGHESGKLLYSDFLSKSEAFVGLGTVLFGGLLGAIALVTGVGLFLSGIMEMYCYIKQSNECRRKWRGECSKKQ